MKRTIPEECDNVVGKPVSGPISEELAAWSSEFRSRWFRSHEESVKLSFGGRVTLAAVGAFVYLLIVVAYVAGNEPYFSLLRDSSSFSRYAFLFTSLTILALAGSAYFLGRLVIVHDEDGGPVRAFLGGVALPAIIVVIARTSLWIF